MNKLMIFTALLLVLFLFVACDTDQDDDDSCSCIEKYPASKGYGYGGQLGNDSGNVPFPHQSIDEARDNCLADDGEHCTASSFITTKAAICLAESMDFDPGLDDWNVYLHYSGNVKTIVWGIANFTGQSGYEWWGDIIEFQASTGEYLGMPHWYATFEDW